MLKLLILLIIFFSFFQLFILRYLKIKINTLKNFFLCFFLLFFLNILLFDLKLLYLTIFFLYLYFCFLITVPGIINLGPSIVLVKIIKENKKINKKSLKKKFLKEKFIEKRLKENIFNDLILIKKRKLFLTKNGKIIVLFFNKISKIFNLYADIK